MFNLRYYQEELIAGARQAWQSHQSVALISCTGSGKTEMYMSLAISEPGRVLVLVHRDYLITQPVQRLASAGFHDVGIEKAESRSEGMLNAPKVVFASVQSIGPASQQKRLESFDPRQFSLVIVDEGHRGVSVTYRRVLDYFKAGNPALRVLVLTATPNRKDGVGLFNICDAEAGKYGAARAMDEGWIVPVRFYRRDVQSLDFSGVRMKGADLDPDQVQELLLQEEPLHEVCASLANDDGPTIVFCPEVAVARAYESLMNGRYKKGSAKALWADSPEEEREEAGKRLASGELTYIFNVNLYTEGYDLPNLLRVVWAAPTASLVRYTQGVGRVFRTHPSLRGLLTGGLEDAETRKQLIAQSPKPYGIVVTYYPQNCKHELCDPVDILGGDELPANVRQYAKQLQEETSRQGSGSSTEDDIETARAHAALLAQLERENEELKVKAVYQDTEFDPMSRRRDRASRSGQGVASAKLDAAKLWPETELASPKQQQWLRWKGVASADAARCTKWRACVVRDLFEMGVDVDQAMSYGKRQALKVRDELKARKEAAQ